MTMKAVILSDETTRCIYSAYLVEDEASVPDSFYDMCEEAGLILTIEPLIPLNQTQLLERLVEECDPGLTDEQDPGSYQHSNRR
jgi:hypothetical protein